MLQTSENKIFNRIRGKGRSWVFSDTDFRDIASNDAVRQSLSRLTKKDRIRRIMRGLYEYPRYSDLLKLWLSPDLRKVAQALARKYGWRIQPSGAYAANLLGLSTQVPAKTVFLTDGPTKTVQINKQQIFFKKTTTKNMATSGRISGLVIQALSDLGQHYIDDKSINTLKRRLSDTDKKQLLKDIRFAPAWIADVFRKVQN
jgi:hypothetical protein